ncbi:MAG: hypothetical protein U0T77_01690 [Chitinophagales bacterium]
MPVYLLNESYEFPPAEGAEEGIVAVGGDLSPQRLLNAYKSGIFLVQQWRTYHLVESGSQICAAAGRVAHF